MRANMLIVSALVAIVCVVTLAAGAFAKVSDGGSAIREGLVLTDFWKGYSSASKADRPKEAAAILDSIILKAKAERLHYDFYTAAVLKKNAVVGRDWKKREEYASWLDRAVNEYSEPIVTFQHRLSKESPASLLEYVLVSKTRLQAARNGAFYDDGLDDLWAGLVEDDYEYALWTLGVVRRSEKAMTLLEEYVGGAYPKAAYLEYRRIADRSYDRDVDGRASRMEAARSFAKKYEGKAISLYAKAILLQERFDSLSSLAAVARQTFQPVDAAYKILYRDCRSAEKERLSYSKGIDMKIAMRIQDFNQMAGSLVRKDIGISFEKDTAVLTLRNLDKVEVMLAPDVKEVKPLIRKTLANQNKSFYVIDTLRVALPKCDDGKYVLTVRNGKVSAKTEWIMNSLSIAVRKDSEMWRFLVAGHITGKPAEKVDVELIRSGKVAARAKDVELCKDGFTPLPEAIANGLKNGAACYLVASFRDKDGFLRRTCEHYVDGDASWSPGREGSTESFCEIFTDKSAYNPGEKVEFKAVLYRGDLKRSLHAFGSGTDVKTELVDPEGNAVAVSELRTNEYGSVAGLFDIPSGGRNGSFQVRVSSKGVGSSKEIVVDEYILPTYNLTFDRTDRLFIAGDTVEVSGNVFSFSGQSMASASLSYSAVRFGKVVASGKMPLEPDGSFSVRFGTGDVGDSGIYGVTVKVVDATGETNEFSSMVPVLGYLNLLTEVKNASEGEVNPSRGDWRGTPCMVSGEKAVVSFVVKNLMDSEIKPPVEVGYSLSDASGKKLVSGKVLSGSTVELALPVAGMYYVESGAEIVREDGRRVSAEKKLMVLRVDDSAASLDAKVRNFFKLVGDCADGVLRPGEDMTVQFGAGEGPVWAVVELFGDRSQLLEHKMVYLDGKVGEAGSLTEINYNYKEEYPAALRLKVIYFRDGSIFRFDREFRRERKTLDLPLSFSTFTDKAMPDREYSLTLKSIPGVEAVAAIFDKSSEVISPNDWPSVRLAEFGAEDVYYSSSVGGMISKDYGIVGYGYSPRRKMMARGIVGKDVLDSEYAIAEMNDGVSLRENAVAPSMMSKGASVAGEEVPETKVRSDFSTSLAFEPFLRSDADGNIFMRFRTSEKLSTFVVQVWAHTEDMRNSLVRKEVTVTVPVKVSVAEPKFLYKGDSFTLHATVSNSSGKDVAGVAALQAYSSKDYEGTKPFASQSRKVTVPAGGSVEVAFDVNPRDYDELGLKVVFADNEREFSDGVFVSLPVYEATQTLTEAHSAVLQAGMDRAALILRLGAGFTGTTSKGTEVKETDLLRMALDALPSKVEPKGKDVLSLTEALYVRRVATSLGTEVEPEMPDVALVEKVMACLNVGGGFGWFEGMRPSPAVTAVVLERLAKMRDAGLDFGGIDLLASVRWLDRNQFLYGADVPVWSGRLSMEQYAYVRSMYASVPFDVLVETKNGKSEYSKNLKEFRSSLKDYLLPSEKDGRGLDGRILAKARRIRTLANLLNNEGGLGLAAAWGVRLSAASRMNESIAADLKSLLEYAARHPDGGWYYPNAVMPWCGLLESETYAHAFLCDLLASQDVVARLTSQPAEASPTHIADGIRLWLMLQKETQKWTDDPAFVDAINSVLAGSPDILATKILSLMKTYSVPFTKVAAAGNGLSIERHFYKEVVGEDGKIGRLEIFPGMRMRVGDKITADYKVWNKENRSFVRLTAPREAAFRPVEQLSGSYGWGSRPLVLSGSWSMTPQGYRDVKPDRTEYWFDVYPEEKTIVSEDFFITQEGTFSAPVLTIESLYAPAYRANASFVGKFAINENVE